METFIPWTLVKRGAKKQVITPLDAPQAFAKALHQAKATAPAEDSPLLQALGLAYHWQRLLNEKKALSVADIAQAENLDISYVRRLLRLSLIARNGPVCTVLTAVTGA